MAFVTYLDASGSALNPGTTVVSMSGWVGHESDWARFDGLWRKTLIRYEITEFHMKDCAQWRGEFKSWKRDDSRRKSFLAELTGVIKSCNLISVGSTVDLAAYEWFNERFFVQERIGRPYSVSAWLSFSMTHHWAAQQELNEPLLFYLEQGDNEQADFRQMLDDKVKWDPKEEIAPPEIKPKRLKSADGQTHYILPFQACDFIAYEHAKAVSDLMGRGKIDVRKSLFNLVPPGSDTRMWQPVNRHMLWNLVRNFNIHARPGHVGLELRMEGPACYLGMDVPLWITAGKFNH